MPGPRGVVRRVQGLLREQGLRAGGRQILAKAAGRIYSHEEYIVLEKHLAADPPGAENAQGLEVREGSEDEIVEFTRAITRNNPVGERKARARLALGYRCILGFFDGRPVSQFWLIDAETLARADGGGDLQVTFFGLPLSPGDAWCFKFELEESTRGGGRATEILRQMEAMLLQSGRRRLLGYVDTDNLPARWVYGISGWKPVRLLGARYLLSSLGVSNGRLLVRVPDRRSETFPYRPLRHSRRS
ncbi:MAG TPA: hypothetical protein VFW80_02040 [Gaiellaceae bacterium]|nr:hypothetical protein [Gaiellaceae bacterium]